MPLLCPPEAEAGTEESSSSSSQAARTPSEGAGEDEWFCPWGVPGREEVGEERSSWVGKRRAPKAVGRCSSIGKGQRNLLPQRRENAHLGLLILLGASLPPPPTTLPNILSSRTSRAGRLLPRSARHRRGGKRAPPTSHNSTEDSAEDARRTTERRSSDPRTTSSSEITLLLGRGNDGRTDRSASREGGRSESAITLAGEGAEGGEVEGVGLGGATTVDLAVGERGGGAKGSAAVAVRVADGVASLTVLGADAGGGRVDRGGEELL